MRFFLVYPNKRINLSGFSDLGNGFHSDSITNLPIDIGCRHENGDGVFLRIQKNNQIISFETDRMNGVPLFWSKREEQIIIASDIDLVVRVAKAFSSSLVIDLVAASEFLIAGYIFEGEKTLIQNVNQLPPNHKLQLDISNGNLIKKHCGCDLKYSKKRLNPKLAPAQFRSILERLFRERYSGKKIAVLLSGGGSSRILASCAVAAGLDVDFYTFGQSTVNDSDFSIANKVAYCLGKKINCFTTNADNFSKNWQKRVEQSNWINDSVWWAGRIPNSFFEKLKSYDVVIRGDGDGCYGWGGVLVSISDILHRFEITPNNISWRFAKYFFEPEQALYPAMQSRNALVKKYENLKGDFLELKNILFVEIREWRNSAPGAWYFSSIMPIDAPFLWNECFKMAFSLPKNKLKHRWLIFEALKLDKSIKDIPLATGGSWDNRLEFYYSGVWEELIDYVKKWSPWQLNLAEFRKEYLKPPDVPVVPSTRKQIADLAKKFLEQNKYIRKIGFKYFSHLLHSSISERLLIRLAIISNLCKKTKN